MYKKEKPVGIHLIINFSSLLKRSQRKKRELSRVMNER
jgi:hypothetical protein